MERLTLSRPTHRTVMLLAVLLCVVIVLFIVNASAQCASHDLMCMNLP
jgi:hypothetical protein